MTRASIEIQQIRQHLRAQILERLQELNLNLAGLAKRIGSPRSTISSIVDDSNSRLPHLYTLIQIARALSLPIEDLLPRNLVSFPEDGKNRFYNFIPSDRLDIKSILLFIQKYNLESPIQYHPRSIPEFCKSTQILCREYGISEKAALDYRGALNRIFLINVNGLIILEESILLDLFDRKGIFSESSRNESLEMVDSIRNFQLKNSGRITTVVSSRSHFKIDPILIITKNLAIADYFGSLLVISDVNLIDHASRKFETIRNESTLLLDWLSRV